MGWRQPPCLTTKSTMCHVQAEVDRKLHWSSKCWFSELTTRPGKGWRSSLTVKLNLTTKSQIQPQKHWQKPINHSNDADQRACWAEEIDNVPPEPFQRRHVVHQAKGSWLSIFDKFFPCIGYRKVSIVRSYEKSIKGRQPCKQMWREMQHTVMKNWLPFVPGPAFAMLR